VTAEIHILPAAPGEFDVDVRDGDLSSRHHVTVSEHLLDDLGIPRAEPHRVVEESFVFLLEREPCTAILQEFALTDITRYFPDYVPELRRRLAGAHD
jgi:hypothetical protein